MNKNLDLELAGLNDEELLELFNKIEEHRAYLEASIIDLAEEKKDEEEKKNESTKWYFDS